LREYEEFNARRRKRIPAVLWPFWAPDPDQFYRWRVQLDCGCIREVMTTDKTQLGPSSSGATWCTAHACRSAS
jgi:hypothetical protein